MGRHAVITWLLATLGGCTFNGVPPGDPGESDAAEAADAAGIPDAGAPDAELATVEYRINIGGGPVVGTEPQNAGMWSADADQCSGNVYGPVEAAINGTADQELYSFYRWNTVRCDLPIANGWHRVRFLLAEVWSGGGSCNSNSSSREMDLELEGQARASIDLVLDTGGCAADPAQPGAVPFDRGFDVEVTDGVLNIAGVSNGDGALVSAIEVLSIPAP